MNFGDAKPQAIPRYGSLVQWDSTTQLPLGLASIVRNCRYSAQSVGTRWGFKNRLKIGARGSSINGLGVLRYLAQNNSGDEYINLLAYTGTDGNIWSAVPFNQPSVTQLSTDALFGLANLVRVPNLNPRICQAFNRGYIAMGDLTEGKAPPMVFDPSTGNLDPASDIPVGYGWTPGFRARVGHIVSPSTFETFGLPAAQGTWVPKQTGHLYRCITAGITANAQPVWPTGTGDTIIDGSAEWQEYTPSSASGLPDANAPITPTSAPDGASPIAPGATVFVVLTYVSAQGEAINELTNAQGVLDTTKVLQWTNTTGSAVDLSVVMPAIPAEIAAGGPLGINGATGYNVYVYIVPGTPDATKYIDGTYYGQVPGSNFAAGATVTIGAYPTGQALPTVNTAVIAGTGNVDTGIRWMVVLFETRTEYQTGFTASAPIRVNVTQSGLALLNQKIPVGPYNTIRRICAFTVAGASAAGPYFYVDRDDVESPGFNQADVPITATTINDNITTSATFNFTDTYLPGASEVTTLFNRIQIPYCSDVYFSKTLQRVIYTGCQGFPSGHLVSDDDDMEGVEVPGSNLQVSEADGDRTVCWREVRENQISLKENSGHAIIPNDGDPKTWDAQAIWRGMGPVGAKAAVVGVDDQNEFLLFAHRTGLYRYIGGTPQLVCRELLGTASNPGIWDQINWAYGYLITIAIDETHREVRISVPMGNSTVRNTVITVDYFFGWEDPVVFVQRRGILVPNVNGRKWSIDDLDATDLFYVPQRYNASNVDLDGADLSETLIRASSDGALYTLTRGQYWDDDYNGNHIGYWSEWLSVPGPNVALVEYQLLGAMLSAIGSGSLNVYAVDEKGAKTMLTSAARPCILTGVEQQRDLGCVATFGNRFGIGFNNGGVAGAWFEMHVSNLMLLPTFATRIG